MTRTHWVVATLALGGLCTSLPLRAADEVCKRVLDAMNKAMVTPSHVYIARTAAFQNKSTNSEMIYTGGPNGPIYVLVNSKWTRSKVTPTDVMKQEEANRAAAAKDTCRYLKDEPVNGEAAAVYTTHHEDQDSKIDVTLWISKASNLPLRENLDTDAGGSMGKSHQSLRFDYTNVKPPADVK